MYKLKPIDLVLFMHKSPRVVSFLLNDYAVTLFGQMILICKCSSVIFY